MNPARDWNPYPAKTLGHALADFLVQPGRLPMHLLKPPPRGSRIDGHGKLISHICQTKSSRHRARSLGRRNPLAAGTGICAPKPAGPQGNAACSIFSIHEFCRPGSLIHINTSPFHLEAASKDRTVLGPSPQHPDANPGGPRKVAQPLPDLQSLAGSDHLRPMHGCLHAGRSALPALCDAPGRRPSAPVRALPDPGSAAGGLPGCPGLSLALEHAHRTAQIQGPDRSGKGAFRTDVASPRHASIAGCCTLGPSHAEQRAWPCRAWLQPGPPAGPSAGA